MNAEWLNWVVSILTGLAAAIPLAVQLVKYIIKARQEKNWSKVVNLVVALMQEAEGKLTEGADKKQWVLAMVKASADTIDFDVDLDQIGNLIDSLCDMSKVVNAPAVTESA